MVGGSKETRLCYVLTDRLQAAGNRGGAENTGTEDFLLLPAVTHVSFLSDSMHRGGFVGVLGLRFVVLDVSVSLSPAVAAAAVRLEFDVPASLLPAVAAAAISTKDDGSLLPTVAAAAHSE